LESGKLPAFDLILLGIGWDGHTDSIFPGDSGIMQSRKLVCAVHLKGFKHKKITLALTILNQAKNIFFVVMGMESRNSKNCIRKQKQRTTSYPP